MSNADNRENIALLSGEFCDRRHETAYRLSQERLEVRQILVVWSLALLCVALYLPVDFASQGYIPPGQLWPRLGILFAGGVMILAMFSRPGRANRDVVSGLTLLLVMGCYGLVLGARHNGSAGALLLLLVGSYLFSPGRFTLSCGIGLCGSGLAVATAYLSWSSSVFPWLEFSYLLPANGLAMLALAQANRSRRRLYRQGQQLQREIVRRHDAQQRLRRSHQRNLALLHNTLPANIARQLRENPGCCPAQQHPLVTISFTDIVGFSDLAHRLSPRALLALLNELFSAFDRLAGEYDLEKIKTVGDAYMAVAGISTGPGRSAQRAALMALDQQRVAASIGRGLGHRLQLRTGLHSGPVIAGVLGSKRYAFDIWGDAVNIAARLETAAPAGKILVSQATRRHCSSDLLFGPCRELSLRGCGRVRACVLYSRLPVAELPGRSDSGSLR